MKKNIRMTEGSPLRLMLAFALPMVLGNIFQQFYSMVDAMVVGRFVSTQALAAIGATSSILFLMISFIIGFTMGTSIVTSHFAGAEDLHGLRSTFATGAWISVIAYVLICTIGNVLAVPALRLLGTPEDILANAEIYIRWNFSTSIAPITYNMIAQFLRALGDSKTPLYALIISSITNIILDLIFVIVFHWGVAGVAIATAIAQIFSAVFCLLRTLRNYPDVIPCWQDWKKPSAEIVKRILKFGLPMSIQQVFISFGMMAIQGIINGFGSGVVAGYTAANKVDQIALQFMNSIGSAMSTYAGQNYGARNGKRLFRGLKAALLLTIGAGLFLTVAMVFAGRYLVLLFMESTESEAIHVAAEYLTTISIFYVLCGISYIYSNLLRGVGKVMIPTASSFVELGVKILSAAVLSKILGHSGIWYAWPAAWIVTDLLLVGYFHLFSAKQLRKLQPIESEKLACPPSL